MEGIRSKNCTPNLQLKTKLIMETFTSIFSAIIILFVVTYLGWNVFLCIFPETPIYQKPKYTIERHHATELYYPKYGDVYLYITPSKQVVLSYPIFGGKRTKDEALEIIKEHKESLLIEIINVD